ncbi:MAG: DNA polymerase III subunit [Sedimentisphaerales bacterium]|nr:DNA polymerase III subunit [Sedimentisphaerales bacterium]
MSLAEVIGQDRAIAQVSRMWRNGRLGHCLIFHGPDGVGKSLTARGLAQLLLCGRPETVEVGSARMKISDGCGVCDDCRMVTRGSHPDLHIVTRDLSRHTEEGKKATVKDLPIGVIRDFVIEPAGWSPQRGRARVFIIEEGERMNRAAQNALLKTLEEPPANTYLIIVTSQPGTLLATVRSRSHAVRFAYLPEVFVRDKLQEAGLSPAEAAYWSQFSGGRLGPALAMARTGWYEVKRELVKQLAGLSYATALTTAQWCMEQAKTYGQAQEKQQNEESAASHTRMGQEYLLALAEETYRLALRGAVGLDTAVDQTQAIGAIGGQLGAQGCGRAVQATRQARGRLEYNVNGALLFEWLMLKYLVCARA